MVRLADKVPAKGVAKPARLRVGFILANHFTLTAFSTFVDTLRLAADEGDGSRPILCSWTVMSASGRPTRSSCAKSPITTTATSM